MSKVETQNSSAQSLFEIGKLYCDRGDFQIARQKLETAAELFFGDKVFIRYLDTLNLLLRIYSEMEDFERITSTKERLQELVKKEKVKLNAKSYYTLGLSACYQSQFSLAIEYLEKSLGIALAEDSKEDICYAISGLAIVYTAIGRLEDALKELYNLKIFFQVMPLNELQLSTLMMNGHILRMKGEFDKAIDVFWQCYDILRKQKNFYMYQQLLTAMGFTYADAGDRDMARMYLQLAKRGVDPENQKFLSRRIDEKLESIGALGDKAYDLIFDSKESSVIEKKKGRVDFKNQFILLDLLRLFLKSPGQVHSKEALVRAVWKQEYDPLVHDNKIYVTIKRLRKLIEPDFDKPKYIFRAKNGYYLNKGVRVLFN